MSSSPSFDNKGTLPATGTCITQGYMKKKGHKRRNWKTRWFVLTNDFLSYYTDKSLRKQKGTIPLYAAFVRHEPNDHKGRNVFHVFTGIDTAHRKYSIEARTRDEQHHWEAAICGVLERGVVTKDGYLLKQSSNQKNWKRKFFQLKGGTLRYYEDKDSKEPRNVLPLRGCTVMEICGDGDTGKRHIFCVRLQSLPITIAPGEEAEGGARKEKFYLAATSVEEMREWIQAIFYESTLLERVRESTLEERKIAYLKAREEEMLEQRRIYDEQKLSVTSEASCPASSTENSSDTTNSERARSDTRLNRYDLDSRRKSDDVSDDDLYGVRDDVGDESGGIADDPDAILDKLNALGIGYRKNENSRSRERSIAECVQFVSTGTALRAVPVTFDGVLAEESDIPDTFVKSFRMLSSGVLISEGQGYTVIEARKGPSPPMSLRCVMSTEMESRTFHVVCASSSSLRNEMFDFIASASRERDKWVLGVQSVLRKASGKRR